MGIMARIDRLRAIRQLAGQTGLAVVVLFGLNQQVMAQDAKPEVPEQAEVHPEPMDEDWQNISTRALLDQLTHMAMEMEQQRQKNVALERKVEALTQRLDGMQATLVKNGTISMEALSVEQTTLPEEDAAIQARSSLPPLDLTQGSQDHQGGDENAPSVVPAKAETQKKPGYIKKMLDAGGSVVRRVTDW